MFKHIGRLGSKPQKWRFRIKPIKIRGENLGKRKLSLGLEKAKQVTWTADIPIDSEEDIELPDCPPLDITITLYETGQKHDGTSLLQRKVGHFVLRSLKCDKDLELQGNLRYNILASVDLPLHDICPSCLDKELQMTLTLHPKKGASINRNVDVDVVASAEILGDVSETDSNFSDLSAMSDVSIPRSSKSVVPPYLGKKTQSKDTQTIQTQALLDQIRVLQMNLERAIVDNENIRVTYEERLASMQKRIPPSPGPAPGLTGMDASPRSVSSINTDFTDKTAVSTRVEVLKIENRTLTDQIVSLKQELRVTQSALIAKENGLWQREHQNLLERLQAQRLAQSSGQSSARKMSLKSVTPKTGDDNSRFSTALGVPASMKPGGDGNRPKLDDHDTREGRQNENSGKEVTFENSCSNANDATFTGSASATDPAVKGGRDASMDTKLAAVVLLLERAEEDNRSLREQLDMLSVVSSQMEIQNRVRYRESESKHDLGEGHTPNQGIDAVGAVDAVVQAEMVYNTDENCFIDLCALEDLNAATVRNLNLQEKLARTSDYFDEEREKVRVLKEVLCRWSAHLSEQDKALLRSAGIILDLVVPGMPPPIHERAPTVREFFHSVIGSRVSKSD